MKIKPTDREWFMEYLSSHEHNVLRKYGAWYGNIHNIIKPWLYDQYGVSPKLKRKLDKLEGHCKIHFYPNSWRLIKFEHGMDNDDFIRNNHSFKIGIGHLRIIMTFPDKGISWADQIITVIDEFKRRYGKYIDFR